MSNAEGTGEAAIASQVAEAKAAAEAKKGGTGRAGVAQRRKRGRSPFKVEGGRLWKEIEQGEGDDRAKKWVAFGTAINVEARVRSFAGEDHGLLLEVIDKDGVKHLWAMPAELFAGRGEAILARLLSLGFNAEPSVGRKWRDYVIEYLHAAQPDVAARCVATIGWHGKAFVLPDETISAAGVSERVFLQTAGPLEHAFNVTGTLADWQQNVARPAQGNSRLMLAIAAGFASPLLEVMGMEGGGFHFRGASSIGKSTALHVAGSVCGGGGLRGYVQNWRATDNGLETVAALHRGAVLCLDELSQVEPKAAAAAAYMIANGKGKARAGKEGQARKPHEWNLVFVSTGEIGLADKIREGGGQMAAGMDVRVIDIRADAGAGLGLFENLHGHTDAPSFANALHGATGQFYGTAFRAFLKGIVADLETVKREVAGLRDAFMGAAVALGADGQVSRVASRFALVAAAGELATALGVTGWPPGATRDACLRCFADWVAERGGTGSGEVAEAKRRIWGEIETYGQARFQDWDNKDRATVTPRRGFVKTRGRDQMPVDATFYFFPAELRGLLVGMDFKAVIPALVKEGVIVCSPKGDPQPARRVPNMGNATRLYQIGWGALTGDPEVTDE